MKLALLSLVLAAGCATLADGHAGLDNPPSARTGPFRLLASGEVGFGRPAPFAMDDGKTFLRDVSVIDLDGDPSTLAVAGYFAASLAVAKDAPPDGILRFDAPDGRSFGASGSAVLSPTLAWEGGTVGAPSAILRGAETWLFYAGAGGIGLAKSSDGATFEKASGPVLDRTAIAWAASEPRSPSVVALVDGTLALFFEADTARGPAIGEARSSDGLAWTLVGAAPAIVGGGALDELGVGSPSALLRRSEEGRPIVDVYFTALGRAGSSIGLASRFGDAAHADDALVKSPSSMLTPSPKLAIREPSVVRFSTVTFLFATENASKSSSDPAVVVGVAPALATLPPPPR
jgi:hypothetical protein